MTEATGFPGDGQDKALADVIDPAPGTRGRPAGGDSAPGTAVAVLDKAQVEQLLAPYTVNLTDWLRMLVTDSEYPEVEQDEIGIGILASILTASTSEEALRALDLQRAKTLCGGEPGGHSPLLEITGARALQSTFEDGPSCYCIVQATIVSTGERIQFTTGGRAVQAVIVKHLGEGWMPFQGILTIRREATKRGFYPLNLEFGG
jgi:hypothetical protein